VRFADELLRWFVVPTGIVLTLVFALDFTRRRRQLDALGGSPMLQRMIASLSSRRRVLKAVLLATSVSLLVTALARPQIPGETYWRQRGIDVALALDYSKSMLARDVYPSRLDRAEMEADELLDHLDADRVATIAFAGAAVHFPLTHDHAAARLLYDGLGPADLPPGSDLGEALRVAKCLLRPDVVTGTGCDEAGTHGHGGDPLGDDTDDPPAKAQVLPDRARAIVVFTDGEDTEGRARAEIEQAVQLGIQVFVVGVGTVAGELVPELDARGQPSGFKKAPDGSFVTSHLDQAGLKELADLAGGEDHYFVLDSKTFALDGLAARLEKLKKGDLDERVLHKPKEVYQWFLFPAFLLLVLEACLSDRKRRVPL
jgi:Ca-activated chloride channel family protein